MGRGAAGKIEGEPDLQTIFSEMKSGEKMIVDARGTMKSSGVKMREGV
jgi:hypothetical protein